MLYIKTNNHTIKVNMTEAEFDKQIMLGSAIMKTMTGVGNNSAWAACLEALDHIKQHPRYKHEVKRAFNAVVEEFHAYERNLLLGSKNRLFHVADMIPESRKRYGDITDREYFEYWAASGATIYTNKRQWFTNLWNKFRLYFINHKVEHPDIAAWAVAAEMVLKLSLTIYEESCKVVSEKVPMEVVKVIFSKLSLERVWRAWSKAVALLEPSTQLNDYTELEQKNIQYGLDQLEDEWTDTNNLVGALSDTTEAFDEIFRTKGEQKKALRMIASLAE